MKLVKGQIAPRPRNLPDSLHLDPDYFSPDGVKVMPVIVQGNAYEHLDIWDRDILVIAPNERPRDGEIILETIEGQPHLERFRSFDFYLAADNGKLLPKRKQSHRLSASFEGTVRFIIRQLKEF